MSRYFSLDFWQGFWQDAVRLTTTRGLKILLILVLYWIARQVLDRVVDAALARLLARHAGQTGQLTAVEHANRLRTLQGLVKSVVGYVLFFVLLIMVLQELDVNVTGLITTAGVGGLAIGFGAQRLVRDVISGFFLIIEDQFSVGEFVTVGGPAGSIAGAGVSGVIEEIGMRVTRLRDEQGRLWTLANGDIVAVVNPSRAPVESYVEVGIAAGADVRRAQEVINAAGETLYREDAGKLDSAPKVLGVAGFDGARTLLRVSVVSNPRSLSAEQLRVREAIREALAREEIGVA